MPIYVHAAAHSQYNAEKKNMEAAVLEHYCRTGTGQNNASGLLLAAAVQVR